MTLRIAAVGAGRVFERLYAPALVLVPGLSLVAVADPDTLAPSRVPAGVRVHASFEELLVAEPCDGVLVLSPPAFHAPQAALALERMCPVLLEKPTALSSDEIASWPEAWRALVTPARPRRYWREYLHLRRELPLAPEFELVLQTSPAAWGALTASAPADDLLPHVLDLAAWLSRSPVVAIHGSEGDTEASGDFELADGRTVRWRVAHADRYDEHVRTADTLHNLSRPLFSARIVRRLYRRPSRDIEGVARMLRLWERRLRGEPVPGLPGFPVALEELTMRNALRRGQSAAGVSAQPDGEV
jgi:predicted dehydrogenase